MQTTTPSRLIPRLAAALAALVLLAGCGLSRTNSGGWISGDGQVDQIAVAQRGPAIDLSGTTLEGKQISLAGTRGKPTVVNVWGAWCGDCIAEAGDLEKAHAQLGNQASFVGIDIRDASVDQAKAFQRAHRITYPSIYSPGGEAVLAFAHSVSPQTIPATLVLDAQGRVAAVIRGTLPSTLTLVEVVQAVAANGPSASPVGGGANAGAAS